MRIADTIAVTDMVMTGEGYLRLAAKLSRTGIQDYYGWEIGRSDNGEWDRVFRIYRDPAEVFSPAALASFCLKPVTDGHPVASVTAETWAKEAKGIVADDVRRDGDHMAATLLLTDAEIINRTQRKGGTVELSCGYDCDLDMSAGVTDAGETYDGRQTNIRGNHVAIVDRGRCGSSCATSRDASTGSPKVVMLFASKETQRALSAWCNGAGFDRSKTHGGTPINPDDFDFHATIIATTNAVTMPTGEHQIPGAALLANGFEVLGKDGNTPVLLLSADGFLADLRRHYVNTYRAEPTFSEFKPHVSLSYSWDGAPAIDGMAVPDFPLVFDRIVVDEFVASPQPKADAMPTLTDCPGNPRCQCQSTPANTDSTKGQDAMSNKTVTIDGKQLEVTADVAAVIEGLQSKVAHHDKVKDAAMQLAEIVEKHTSVKAAEIAAKDAEIADLKGKVPTADQIAATAAELASVMADAKSIAPDLDTKGQTADAIRLAAAKVAMGDKAASLDGRSADYVAATFDRLVDAARSGGGSDPLRDGFKAGSGAKDAAQPHKTYLDSLANAWKGA